MKKDKAIKSNYPFVEPTNFESGHLTRFGEKNLAKEDVFFISGISGIPPENLSKAELISEHKALTLVLISMLKAKPPKPVAKFSKKGTLSELGIKDLSPKLLIRLALLRLNGVPDHPPISPPKNLGFPANFKLPHPSSHEFLANSPTAHILRPPKDGPPFMKELKGHILNVIEDHLGGALSNADRQIILDMDRRRIQQLLEDLN